VAEEVFRFEDRVNHLEVEIEEAVLRLLALRQPIAGDLRLLTSVLKITSDLERVADQAVNISQTAQYLLREPELKPLIDIPQMARLSQKMIREALEAFVKNDAKLADAVCRADDEVDRLRDQIFKELLAYMTESPKNITRAVDLILIARNLERVADHATNIAEDVIFIAEGKNVKHHFADREAPPAA
jgi:phosphate transport system protein